MKTKVLLLALLSGFVFSVAAQEYQPQVGFSNEAGYKTNFKKNKARDNWFISIAGGASVLLGDQNGEADFKNRLNFAPQVSFGKWFNPYLGFRTQLNGGIIHGFEGDGAQFMQHNKYVAAHVDLLWDVTNFWAPYRESKVFRLIPWVGFGYAQRFKTTESYDRPRTESPTLNAGILTAFRLSKRVDLNVEIQGSLLNEQFNRVEMNHLTDGIVQLSAGLTFKLDKNQQINIYNTAEFMKNNNAPIKVVGYADKKTGTSDYNMGLSEKRARAVAKELIDKYGISSSQITIEWRGSDEQPYGENSWNRVVIMSANN